METTDIHRPDLVRLGVSNPERKELFHDYTFKPQVERMKQQAHGQ